MNNKKRAAERRKLGMTRELQVIRDTDDPHLVMVEAEAILCGTGVPALMRVGPTTGTMRRW